MVDSAPLRLTVVGDLLEDILVSLEGPIRVATDTKARIARRRGGSAATTAMLAAEGGASVRFVGAVGKDARGTALVAELEQAGVEAALRRRGATGSIVILVHPDGERTMLSDRGASATLYDPDASWVDDAALVHCSFYAFEDKKMADAMIALVDRAHDGGSSVSVDVASTGLMQDLGKERTESLLRRIAPHLVLANDDEYALLPPLDSLVVVKRGPSPAEAYYRGALIERVPVLRPAHYANSTGAGDAFAAGFLLSWGVGAALQHAMKQAHNAAGSYLARVNGEYR